MKLHLPKALLTAVLAVCVAQDALATITVDTNAHTAKDSDSAWEMTYDPATTTIYSAGGTTEIKTGTKNDIILSKGDLFLQTWNGPADINLEGDLYMGSTLRVGMDHHNVNINNIYLIDSCKIYQYDDNKNRPYPVNITGTVTDKILSSNGSVVNTGSTLTLDNHTFNFSGKVDISGLLTINEAKITLTGNTTISGSLGMRQGSSISFTDGEHNIQKFDIHNSNDATTETLTISGATVKITGSDGDITGGAATAAAVTIGHWNNGSANVIVGGNAEKASLFDVSGATIRMSWDSASALEIKENGTVNAKRIQFANDNSDNAVITLAGGRLNLGDGGVSANSSHDNGTKKRELNLNSGTLGALAESVNIAAGTTNIGGAITIDTAIVDAEGEKTGNTATISFSNNVVLSDAAAFTIKGGGSVSINALAVKNTLKFDVQEATVLNVENVSLSLQDGAIALDTANVYTDNSNGSFTSNGFKKGGYQLFDGYEWNGSETIDSFEVVTYEGDTLLLDGSVGTTYYVNKGTHTISTASDYIKDNAEGYHVAKNAGLVIDGASDDLSAADLLTGTTGEGNITVKTNISLSDGAESKATGKLIINNDATLTMGGHKNNNVSIESFNYITLDGGTIMVHAASTEFKNVTITANGGTLKVDDMQDNRSPHLLSGVTTIEKGGTFTLITSKWRQNTNIALLTGEGNLVIEDGYTSANKNDDTVINISELKNFSGSITVDAGTDGVTKLNATTGGAVNLKGITLAGGANGWIKVKNTDTSNTSSLGAVSLSGGSDLRIWNVDKTGTTNITTLTVSGSATLGTYRDGSSFQGTVNIASLSSQGESAELTLKNASQTDNATIFNLNGGTFVGTLNLEADSSKGKGTAPNRKLHVYLNDADVAAGAVINFQNPSTDIDTDRDYNYITLGVGVKDVDGVEGCAKVAGLTGTTTNAAIIKATEGTKTLEIVTADGKTYETNAKVENSINLVKSGAGKQTITGAVNANSVTVNGGELQLSGAENLGDVNIGAGSLSISNTGTTTATTTLNTLQGSGSLSFTGNDTARTLVISSLQGYTGSLTVTKGTGATSLEVTTGGAATLTGLTLENGANMTLNGGNLTVGSNLKMSLASGITLDKDASYSQGVVKIIGLENKNSSITRNDEGQNDNDADLYKIENHRFNINNAAVEVTSDSNVVVSNRLMGVELVNKGKGTVTAGNGYNNYTAIHAEQGNMTLNGYNAQKQQGIVNSLSIGDGLIVEINTNWPTDKVELKIATIEATAFTVGNNSVLKANLTLTNGASITLNGYGETAATITGTLELGTGLELSGNVVKAIEEMQVDDKLLLLKADAVVFGKLDDAAYGEYADLAVAAEAMVEATPLLESIVDARTYFSSLNVGDYQLLFEQGALYIQKTASIPEPTTATLSLLALAALASRRRRK